MKYLVGKEEIEILEFSSNGNPRLLKAMWVSSYSTISISEPENNTIVGYNVHQSKDIDWSWFAIGNPLDEISNTKIPSKMYVQDTVYIRTKLCTRFLKPYVVSPMGNYFESVSHLITLAKENYKDTHMLTMIDLKPEDKINYTSTEKMCLTKVLELLPNMSDTLTTIIFLTIMNYITTAYLINI